jgi:hypothetical protein
VLIDGGMPAVTEQLQVEGHRSHDNYNARNVAANHDTQYIVNFSDGKERSCTVTYSAYEALNDGDTVTVRSSRLLHHCLEIRRGDEAIMSPSWWKIGCLIGGLLCIAGAIVGKGTYGSDDEEPGITIRL